MAIAPVIWLLGQPGSGKTTLGSLLRLYLESQDYDVEFIDTNRLPKTSFFWGVGKTDRLQNIHNLREYVLDRQADDIITIVAAVTPYAAMRELNRDNIPFYREVWVRCREQILTRRKNLSTLPSTFSQFDLPQKADLVIDTDQYDLGECYAKLRNLAIATLEESQRLEEYLDNYEHAYSQNLSLSF